MSTTISVIMKNQKEKYRPTQFTLHTMLPFFGKKKQVTKVTFLVKEQSVSVIFTDVNGIS